jgi:peptide methionine sulfoxide reductase MsrB
MADPTDFLRSIHRSRVFTKPLRFISKRYGENVYNRADSWDILIILDAAQYKIMKEIATEYPYVESVDKIKSRGSHSSEWCYNTFVRDFEKYKDLISKTHYINGNIISTLVLEGEPDTSFLNDTVNKEMLSKNRDEKKNTTERIDSLKSHHPVWKNAVDSENAYIPPDLITNKTIELLDDMENSDKAILHYMQPHEPFVKAKSERMKNWPNSTDISMFNMEDEEYENLLNNYKKNHRFILEHLEKLLTEVPNEKSVVVTADHGNITNKILGVPYTFGHPNHVFFSRDLRHVPWIEIDQSKAEYAESDENNSIIYSNKDLDTRDVKDQLEDLGYK